mmetsp:Transcript_43188/g.101968  ORF Transcript_43188/g.101968 Transcript_43188/m.101968 type:complete len:614 (+) Transcript_43188:81-1922(+)|eukprot:CAMPEP_0177709930 /NCGR_PEP_ID=MMETSP0484_2-20121128/11064_1 /TAXON_ID=354590 /ORGANISM="Rhodomonas lens, Strain RHODO" /LENGTH=613 /DNA_ID=CAMNT_0019221577 /DNA_START=3 /DNA_END=1844 /DNA_ORIENTATION=-
MSAKEELAKKRERLAELRRAKTERAGTAAAASPQQPSLEEVLAAAGIKAGDEANISSPAPSSQVTPAQTPAKTPAAGGEEGGLRESRKLNLTISEAVLVEVPGKVLETYDKVIQTEVTEEDGKDEDETAARIIPTAVSEEGDKDEDAEEDNNAADEQKEEEVQVMSEAEWGKVTENDDFRDFFFRSSKVMERALGQQKYDILKDYSTDDASNQAGEDALSLLATFGNEKLTADRAVTNVEWSMHHPELLLASYHNPLSPEGELLGAEGLVCVWNLRAGQQSEPEYHLRCQSAPTCAIVNRYSPHCFLGGTLSGQVVLWDVRAQRTPVARTPLSAGGHTQPVVKVQIVGTHHAHSLLSLSNDAKLSTWTLTKLSEPIDSVTLHDGGASGGAGMSVTAMAFSDSDVNEFLVGCEDGAVWSGSRKTNTASGAAKGKLGEKMEGHFAPVTGIHIHPSSNESFQADLSHLALSSSMDSSCMLWDRRLAKQLVNLEIGGSEYVQACQWSPSNLSLLAACDAAGSLHLWDLAVSLEGPVAQAGGPGSGAEAQRGLNALGWGVDGKSLAVGDSGGKVQVYGVRSEVAEARSDAVESMYAALASAGQYDTADIRGGGGGAEQ